MRSKGFSLVELLTIISILAILASIGLVSFSSVQSKGRDSNRKQDLRALSVALELYKQSNGTYFSTSSMQCNTGNSDAFYTAIGPFMSGGAAPPDPRTQEKYCYFSLNSGESFRLFAKLENCSDKDVINPGSCSPSTYNFSVVSTDLTITLPP